MKRLKFLILSSVIFVLGCSTPVRTLYETMAEEKARVRFEEQTGKKLKDHHSDKDLIEGLNRKELSLWKKLKVEAEQEAVVHSAEIDRIVVKLLQKTPSEMTLEEFQIYLLIEQKRLLEQQAKNARKWQDFDVGFRVGLLALGVIGVIVASGRR